MSCPQDSVGPQAGGGGGRLATQYVLLAAAATPLEDYYLGSVAVSQVVPKSMVAPFSCIHATVFTTTIINTITTTTAIISNTPSTTRNHQQC